VDNFGKKNSAKSPVANIIQNYTNDPQVENMPNYTDEDRAKAVRMLTEKKAKAVKIRK
jgi:hypothetical protein